ncbi:hypothetical protein CC2G_006574 [Coprinopsis cinerea AmutBmut pab1-1]|nr:hypothetical protein CC2G_006574 [Coprinopsis cinerea AmutBmut pab1-1]
MYPRWKAVHRVNRGKCFWYWLRFLPHTMSVFRLYPRKGSSLATDYCTGNGQVIYKVSSRSRLTNKTLTVERVQLNDTEEDFQDRFREVGRLVISRIGKETIRMTGGEERKVTDIFKRKGWPKIDELAFALRSKRVTWKLTSYGLKLARLDHGYTDVGSQGGNPPRIVAEYSPSGSRPSLLYIDTREIQEPSREDVDLIFVSFLYAETMRRAQEPRLMDRSSASNWLYTSMR